MLHDLLSDLLYRLRALVRRSAVERELDDELGFHIERQTSQNVAAGMPQAEARTAALRSLGGIERRKEEIREAHGVSLIEHFVQDLTYALRGLLRSPGFTVAVVVTLGLGIGANAVMFSIVDRMLFRAPPLLRDPGGTHRIYVGQTYQGTEDLDDGMPYPRYLDLTNWTKSFVRTALFTDREMAIGAGADSREMDVGVVSASFFGFFDAPPALGRYFTETEESPPEGKAVAVLSYALWETKYGRSRDVLGSRIQIGSTLCTIIGVAPAGFVGLWPASAPAAFIPIPVMMHADGPVGPGRTFATNYGLIFASMMSQRRPGVSVAAADADLSDAMRRSYAAQRARDPWLAPVELARPRALAASVLEERGPNESALAKVATWVSGVALVVLLIACANVANLLLARAMRRRHEIAVRLALGVTRGRLLSQLLTESMVLALMGGLVGILIAQWGGALLSAHFLPRDSTSAMLIRDPRTLLFAGAAALLAGVLAGLTPVFQAWRVDVTNGLKTGGRDGHDDRSRTRAALLLFQGVLSMVMLVGAGLFVRSLDHVRAVPLGYEVDPILLVDLDMRGVELDSARSIALRRQLLETAQAIPGVERASRQLTSPFRDDYRARNMYVAGIDSVQRLGTFHLNAVTRGYFATMGTRILKGRGISDHDKDGSPGAMVVSDAMAKLLWPGKDAIGQCVKLNADTTPCRYVVGIAANTMVYQLGGDPTLMYYMPAAQWSPRDGGLVIRVRGSAVRSSENIRRRLQQVMPGGARVTVTPLSAVLGARTRNWKLGALMFSAFGILALALAAIGMYGVVAYGVSRRIHEMGVRVALGARLHDVVSQVVSEAMKISALGIVVGGALALACGRWIAPLLFEESPRDPVVFGLVSVVLLGAALLASLGPAWRAGRVDPVIALRAE